MSSLRTAEDPALASLREHDRRVRIARDTTDRAQLQRLGSFVDERRANPPGVVWVRVERPGRMADD